MLDPTVAPASNTSGRMPRSIRCAAAARPTGPAPITATGSSPGRGSSSSAVAAALDVVAVDPAAQPQLDGSPAVLTVDAPQQDSFAADSPTRRLHRRGATGRRRRHADRPP